MPNWKKLIVSGSNATLSSLNVTNAVIASSATISGNVGIGTDSPSTKLEIDGGTSTTLYINSSTHNSSTANEAILQFGYGHSGTPDASGSIKLVEESTNSFGGSMLFSVPVNNGSGGSSLSEAMRIASSGNVGIGVTDSDAKLEIKGTGAVSGLTFKTTDASSNETFYINDGGTTGVRYFPFKVGVASGTTNVTNSRFQIATTSGNFVVLNDGKTGLGTDTPSDKLEVIGNVRTDVSNGGGFMLTGASASGLVRNNATGVALRTNTTDRLIIDNAGNVGIGHSVLYHKFTVNGNIDIRGGDGSHLNFNNGDAKIVINNNGSGRDLSFETYNGSSLVEAMRIGSNSHISASGAITASAFVGDGSALTGINTSAVGYSNDITLSADYTTAANSYNSLYGPLTVANGTNITVTAGSSLKIEAF